MSIQKLSIKKIHEDILEEARVLGMHGGEAELIADRVDASLEQWIKNKSMVGKLDLEDFLVKELKKYNKDLAYLYKVREKLI